MQPPEFRQEFLGYRPRLDGLREGGIGSVMIEYCRSYLKKVFLASYRGVDFFCGQRFFDYLDPDK